MKDLVKVTLQPMKTCEVVRECCDRIFSNGDLQFETNGDWCWILTTEGNADYVMGVAHGANWAIQFGANSRKLEMSGTATEHRP